MFILTLLLAFLTSIHADKLVIVGRSEVWSEEDGTQSLDQSKPTECLDETRTNGNDVNSYGDYIGTQCCRDVDGSVQIGRYFSPAEAQGNSNCRYGEWAGSTAEKLCCFGVNYDTAKSLCEDRGDRLCTWEEANDPVIQAKRYDNSGCSYDAFHIWTTTPCGDTGCADGNTAREVVADKIYACPGTFTEPGGVFSTEAESLCADRYHICRSASETDSLGLTQETCNAFRNGQEFFATQESSPGNLLCTSYFGVGGFNDVWGCGGGNFGPQTSCGSLTGVLGQGSWGQYWALDTSSTEYGDWSYNEARLFSLTNSEGGGVLCCAGGTCPVDDTFTFDWDKLTAEGNDGATRQIPAYEVTRFEVEDSDLSLNIEVKVEFLVRVSADDEVDEEGNRLFNWPVTYVLDFEDYDAHSNLIYEPGTCSNRDSSVFYTDTEETTPTSFEARWASNLNTNDAGTIYNMQYPPTSDNDWTIIDSDCEFVTYRGHFTWQELRDCKKYGSVGAPFTTVDDPEDGDNINLRGTFYINVVSPFWYNKELNYYRVYQILSQPFVISVSKSIEVLGSAGINLLTISVIAVYKEGTSNNDNVKTGEDIFRLIVLTEAAEYLALSDAELFNYGGAYEGDLEVVSESVNGNCLENKNYICSQLWEIRAENVVCSGKEVDPSADDQNTLTGGIDFSGDYSLLFTAGCIADHPDEAYCNTWLDDHPDIAGDNAVKLTATLTWRDYVCDPILFEVQFGAVMVFYSEQEGSDPPVADWNDPLEEKDSNGVTTHLYQVGDDTVYVEITSAFPSDTYHIFDTTLLDVWICTFAPLVDPGNVQDYTLAGTTGCLNSKRDTEFDDDFHKIYSKTGDINEHSFDLIANDGDEDDSAEIRFSFKVPNEVQRDTLYVHANIEVSLTELEGSRRIRRRLLVSSGPDANQIGGTNGKIGIKYHPNKPAVDNKVLPDNNNNKPAIGTQPTNYSSYFYLTLSSPWIFAIGCGLGLLLLFNIILMCYMNCCNKNADNNTFSVFKLFTSKRRRGYTSVTVDSDDFDSSEANPINVNVVSSDVDPSNS